MRTPITLLAALLTTTLLAQTAPPKPTWQDPYAGKKKVLAIGDVRTGWQHDSVSHALATIERLGRESGDFVVFIRTDTQLLTKSKVWGTGKYAAPPEGTRGNNAKNLDYFDAIFFIGLGEEDLTAQQKKDFLAFVHDDGKGFVGAHSATDAFYTWPEYGNMVGAYFDAHPWSVFNAPVVIEQPASPFFKGLPSALNFKDEIYVFTNTPYARDKVDVLARLDATKLNLKVKDLHRTDNDFPIAWTKTYGKGRVFYSSLGHPDEAWDDPRIQQMYLQAIRWSLGLIPYTPQPHPLPVTP